MPDAASSLAALKAQAAQESAGGSPVPSLPLTPSSQPNIGNEDWKLWGGGSGSSGQSPPQGIIPYAVQVGQGIWNMAKGIGSVYADSVDAVTGGDVRHAVTNKLGLTSGPGPTQKLYQQVVQPQVDQGQQAVQSFKQGDYSSAFGHGLAAVSPGFGPAAANIGEKLGDSDWTGAAADATVLGGGMALPHVVGPAWDAISKFTAVDPDIAFRQAVPMRGDAFDYMERSPTVRGDIKSAAAITDPTTGQITGYRPLDNVPNVLKAVQAAKATNRAVLDMHLDPFRHAGIPISGAPIGDAIDATIPTSLKIEAQSDPVAAARVDQIHKIAQAYRVPLTVDSLRDLATETNGDLNSFYHKTADAQNAAVAQQGGQAVLEAKASAIREMMQNLFGDDVADIQRRWGYLDDVEAGLRKKYGTVLDKETPVSPADALLQKSGAPGKMLHGDTEGARYALTGGKTNSLLGRTFQVTDPSAPLPIPGQGMGGPGGIPQSMPPSRQLPPATPRLSAPGFNNPREGSYVSSGSPPPQWQMNQWQGIGAQKQLPPGSAPYTQGTSVPDVAGRPDLPRTPIRRQLPPGQTPSDFGQGQIITPPPADTSAVHGPPAMTAPPTTRTLPPAQQFNMPPSDASGPHPTTSAIPWQSGTGPSQQVVPPRDLPSLGKVQNLARKLGKQIADAQGGQQ